MVQWRIFSVKKEDILKNKSKNVHSCWISTVKKRKRFHVFSSFQFYLKANEKKDDDEWQNTAVNHGNKNLRGTIYFEKRRATVADRMKRERRTKEKKFFVNFTWDWRWREKRKKRKGKYRTRTKEFILSIKMNDSGNMFFVCIEIL